MIKGLAINVARFILAATLIVSGFVKAIDPTGTQIKSQDYLEALGQGGCLPDVLTMCLAVGLSALEFVLGMCLLFAIYRRTSAKVTVMFMAVMTCITVWIYVANPVEDCGCFGDAIHLTNGQTLAKNIILLALALVVAWEPMRMPHFVSIGNRGIVLNYTLIFILAVSGWCLYDLPLFDFRPYHIGANIKEGMEMPEDAQMPVYDTTFILEKDGVRKEFTLDDYPDSTWTFIDTETKLVKEGYVPPIHDFSIELVSKGAGLSNGQAEIGDDITEEVLTNDGYTFLLVAPHVEQADDSNFGNIDLIYEYAEDNGYRFLCLTASGDSAIARWRDLTGAEYPFAQTDETTLKTIIRSNPGLLLLKKGTIIGKWSHNRLPKDELLGAPLEKSDLGKIEDDAMANKLMIIALWFVLPLTVIVITDRLWLWTRWLKRRKKRNINPVQDAEGVEDNNKQNNNNEKENCSR